MAQKRSENTYQKINTLYKRDEKGYIIMDDEFCTPEFEFLRNCKWEATEKVDGTNIRVEVTSTIEDDIVEWNIEFKGKTDRAAIPPRLLKHLQETFTEERVFHALGIKKIMTIQDVVDRGWVVSKENPVADYTKVPKMYTLYGEGYGVGIQGCGGRYIKGTNSFIGFDVKVDGIYLLRDSMLDIYNKMNIPTVPYHGLMTIDEAVAKVSEGFVSAVSEDRELIAEGLVLKTPIGLCNRNGERILVKIKHCDYAKLKNKK